MSAVRIWKKVSKWAWQVAGSKSHDGYDTGRAALDAWKRSGNRTDVPVYIERDEAGSE